MITIELITEITSLYKKHGWNPSRVLLSPDVKNSFDDAISNQFENVEIVDSQIDAIWFSRPSKHGTIAWELRHLSNKPFAIFELIDANVEVSVRQETLKKIEQRLQDYASNL